MQVENVLNDLETRFETMSQSVLERREFLSRDLASFKPHARLTRYTTVNNVASKADSVENSLAKLIENAQAAAADA